MSSGFLLSCQPSTDEQFVIKLLSSLTLGESGHTITYFFVLAIPSHVYVLLALLTGAAKQRPTLRWSFLLCSTMHKLDEQFIFKCKVSLTFEASRYAMNVFLSPQYSVAMYLMRLMVTAIPDVEKVGGFL